MATVNGVPVLNSAAAIRDEITEIYRVYNTAKVPEVPRFMEKYRGRELEMMHQIQAKYGVQEAGASGMSVMRRGIEKMIAENNPEKLGNVGALVVRYTEEVLFQKLRIKYGAKVKPVVIEAPARYRTNGVMATEDGPDGVNMFMMQMKRFDGGSTSTVQDTVPLTAECPRFEAEIVSDCSGDIEQEEIRLSKMTTEERAIHSEHLLKLWRTDDEENDNQNISQAAVVHAPANITIGLAADNFAFERPPGQQSESVGQDMGGMARVCTPGRGEAAAARRAVSGDVVGCEAIFKGGVYSGRVRFDVNGADAVEVAFVSAEGSRLEAAKAAAVAAEEYDEAKRLKQLQAVAATSPPLYPAFVLGRGDRVVLRRIRRAGGALRDITNRSTSPAVSPVADSTSSFEEEDWLGDGPAAALEFADGVDYECPAADRDGCVSEDLRMCYDQLEWLQTLARQQECSLTEVLATLVAFCNGEDAARKKVIFRNPRCRRCTAATQGGKKATARLGLAPAHLNWLRRTHERCEHSSVSKTVRIMLDWYKLYAGNEVWERQGEDGVAQATSFGGLTTLNVEAGPGKR